MKMDNESILYVLNQCKKKLYINESLSVATQTWIVEELDRLIKRGGRTRKTSETFDNDAIRLAK